jgi:hypothetical protein
MMLSSHYWPGMMFAFLLLLLTPMGAEICCSCFLDEDVEEPDYDWDSAPAFDLDNVYKPPILRQHVNHGNDIHHTLTRNSDNEVKELEKSHPMTPVLNPQRVAPSTLSQTTTRVPSP